MRRHRFPFGQFFVATASIRHEFYCHGYLPCGLCVDCGCRRVWMQECIQFCLVRVQGCDSRGYADIGALIHCARGLFRKNSHVYSHIVFHFELWL